MVRRDLLHLRVQRAGVQDSHGPSSKRVSCLNSTMLDAAPLHLHRQTQPCDLRSNLLHIAPKLLPLF